MIETMPIKTNIRDRYIARKWLKPIKSILAAQYIKLAKEKHNNPPIKLTIPNRENLFFDCRTLSFAMRISK